MDTITDAQTFLLNLPPPQKGTYGIDRMQLLLKCIQYPKDSVWFRSIHVAGTNGKGSVCAMLESIYRQAGYKTGLFTSPHLVYVHERIKVNGVAISEEKLRSYLEYFTQLIRLTTKNYPETTPSFFEIIFAIALRYFAEEKIDIAFIETGLGGEYDATNVIQPFLSIITTISKDHMEILGDSIESIARAKAGIIKPGTPSLIGVLPPEAEVIVRAIAAKKGSRVQAINKNLVDLMNRVLRPAYVQEDPTRYANTIGSHQIHNAMLAATAVGILNSLCPVEPMTIIEGIKNIHLDARFGIYDLNDGKRLVLDVTHNEGGCPYLEENLTKLTNFTAPKKLIILVSSCAHYRAEVVLKAVAPYASEIILITPPTPKAIPAHELVPLVPKTFQGKVRTADLDEIFPDKFECTLGDPGEHIVATGSFYLAGAVMKRAFPGYIP